MRVGRYGCSRTKPSSSTSSITPAIIQSDAFKKNTLTPRLGKQWVIPLEANRACVAAMHDVPAVYTPPRDPGVPLVCLDEATKQLIKETREPDPMKPGQPARFDYEYERI
jgi:hypothetical protein